MDNNIKKTKIPQGYKQTPIGVIPEDWKVKELGDLCRDICGEYGANKSAIPYSSDLPRYVRITDINDEGNLHFDSKASADLSLEEEKKFKLEHHDLLFARTGATVGKSYLHKNEIDKKFVYAGFLIRFRLCPNKVNPIFIRGYTNTSKYWHWVKTYSARSGQPGLNSNEYKSLKLPIPPLPEQKAIADCLSTWDSGIEKLTALIESKKQQKKGLMQQLLTGKKRLDGFTEEWKEVRLGDISIKKSSTLQAGLLVENSGEYNVYGASGFLTSIDSYDEEHPYIAIVKDGSGVGNTFILEGQSSVLGTLDKIFPKNSNLIFLHGLIKRLNYEKYKVGGAIPHIYFKDYSKEKISLPCIEEQNAIVEILTTADNEIELLEKKLETFKTQKKGLMQVLLTGEKRLIEN